MRNNTAGKKTAQARRPKFWQQIVTYDDSRLSKAVVTHYNDWATRRENEMRKTGMGIYQGTIGKREREARGRN